MSTFPRIRFISTAAKDDILDEADTRRGEEAAHVRLGERAAALVGDFLFLGQSEKKREATDAVDWLLQNSSISAAVGSLLINLLQIYIDCEEHGNHG